MDVAIVDVPWNGILESTKIACDVRGLRGQLRAAQLLRSSVDHDERAHLRRDPTRIMEIDIDDVPWKDEVRARRPSRPGISSCPMPRLGRRSERP